MAFVRDGRLVERNGMRSPVPCAAVCAVAPLDILIPLKGSAGLKSNCYWTPKQESFQQKGPAVQHFIPARWPALRLVVSLAFPAAVIAFSLTVAAAAAAALVLSTILPISIQLHLRAID